jgi:Protein of unknown function (DUF5661)
VRRGKNMPEGKEFTTAEAKGIGDAIGMDWNRVDLEQFRMGLAVESEHGSDDPKTNVTHGDYREDRLGTPERVSGLLHASRENGKRSRGVLVDEARIGGVRAG